MEKQLQVWALKKNIKPVMLDTLAAMYVTCNMFLMHCFDFSKSNNDLSFQKVHFFKTKIIKTAEKEPYYSRGARDSKIGKKWPESSRILDYILS